VAKFLKHLNLQIYKYWYILCCGDQTKTHYETTFEDTEIPIPAA